MKRHSTMTAARRLWLETLTHGPARRPKSRVGFDCMQLGWTEWNYLRPDGMPISEQEARTEFGQDWFHVVKLPDFAERITEAGRAALRITEPLAEVGR